MKRSIILGVVLLFLAGSWLTSAGRRFSLGPYQGVVLKGTPYERGFQFGRLFYQELHTLANLFREERERRIEEAFLLFRPLAKISLRNRLEKMASTIPEEHLKELKGVALGSGLSWDDLLWMTFSPDFFSPGGKLFAFQHKEWVVGRTLESPSPLLRLLSEKSLILYVEPSEGYRHLAFGFQNSLLFPTAINEHGLIIAFNGEGSERKDNLSGWSLVKWVVQRASTLAEAERLLLSRPLPSPSTVILSSLGEKRSIKLETLHGKAQRKETTRLLLPKRSGSGEEPPNLSVASRLERLSEDGTAPERILTDQGALPLHVASDSVNGPETLLSLLIYENRKILFCAGPGYAAHRTQAIFSFWNLLNQQTESRLLLRENLSEQERLYLLYRRQTEASSKDAGRRLQALESVYGERRFSEYYLLKAEALKEKKMWTELLSLCADRERSGEPEVEILLAKIEALRRCGRKKDALDLFQKVGSRPEWAPYRERVQRILTEK